MTATLYRKSFFLWGYPSGCCCPFAQLCLTLWDSMDYSMPGFPVLRHLLEFAQTHVHWVDDTIQPSCPVTPFSHLQSFPASRSFPMSWLFASGGQSIGASASVLPVNIQGWFPLGLTGLVSFQSKGLSRLFLNITVQKVLVEKKKKPDCQCRRHKFHPWVRKIP